MTNDEIQMTKDSDYGGDLIIRHLDFDIPSTFGFRHSTFQYAFFLDTTTNTVLARIVRSSHSDHSRM